MTASRNLDQAQWHFVFGYIRSHLFPGVLRSSYALFVCMYHAIPVNTLYYLSVKNIFLS